MGDLVQLPGLSHDQVRERLHKLATYLNKAYGVDLALVVPDRRETAAMSCLVVHRGMTVDDVIVAVSLTHLGDGVYQYAIAVFTFTAWFEYGDPFMAHEELTVRSSAQFISHYVPFHPAT